MNNIRAVAFDYGGVLASFISKEDVSKMATLARVDYESFNTSMWKFRHQLDSDEYDNSLYWKAVLDHCNSPLEEEDIPTLVEMDLIGFSHMNQAMLNWAKELKENGIMNLIISNMATSTYLSLIAGQEWVSSFDEIIISGILHINKPDIRIFTQAITRTQLHSKEILFIDDLPHNIKGAKEAGLHALLFSNTQHLAHALEKGFPTLPRKELGVRCK